MSTPAWRAANRERLAGYQAAYYAAHRGTTLVERLVEGLDGSSKAVAEPAPLGRIGTAEVTPVADPLRERSDEWWAAARVAIANLLRKALVTTGENASPQHIMFLRDAAEGERRLEANLRRRLDSLQPPPGYRPEVTIRRVDEGRSPIR